MSTIDPSVPGDEAEDAPDAVAPPAADVAAPAATDPAADIVAPADQGVVDADGFPVVPAVDAAPSAADAPPNVTDDPTVIDGSTGESTVAADPAATNPVDPAGAPAGADTPVNPADLDEANVPEQAVAPATGEPLVSATGAPIAPLDPEAEPVLDVEPADNQPPIAFVPAHADPSGAAGLVLDHADEPDPVDVVPSLSEVSAQSVVDDGTLTPPQPGSAVHPVETLAGKTVDPSGTADDSHPGVAPVNGENALEPDANDPHAGTDQNPRSIDQRVDPADQSKGVAASLETDAMEIGLKLVIRSFASEGLHRDVVNQWVIDEYAALQGRRMTAASAGEPDPYPLLVF